MPVIQHNPDGVFPPYRNYCHGCEIRGDARLLIISGLNGLLADGATVPESFEDQAELIWTHLQTVLRAAGMDLPHLVSLRTYLAHPMYDEPMVRIRSTFLGTHRVASTVVCCQLLDPRWKLEVEAMAAA
jgi:2-iminobutanoate/2-iminopropanoate deaminase